MHKVQTKAKTPTKCITFEIEMIRDSQNLKQKINKLKRNKYMKQFKIQDAVHVQVTDRVV